MAPEANRVPFRSSNFSHWEKEAFLAKVREGIQQTADQSSVSLLASKALPWGKKVCCEGEQRTGLAEVLPERRK